MKIYFIDESNIAVDSKLEFFIYGGIVLGAEDIQKLGTELCVIKEKNNIPKERPIKWENIRWKGIQLDPKIHSSIKQEVLQLVSNSSAEIIIYLAPHDFYHSYKVKGRTFKKTIDKDRQILSMKFALNICLQKFNQYLSMTNESGLVIADQFADGLNEELLSYCLGLYPGGTMKSKLECIIHPVLLADNEYSYIHQINDIVLGAIQFSLKELNFNFLPILKNNFWTNTSGNKKIIKGYGFNAYPKKPATTSMVMSLDKLVYKFEKQIDAS